MTVDDLIKKHYAGVSLGERVLATHIEEAISKEQFPILDAGCGSRAKWIRRFGANGHVIGMDLDVEFPPGLPIVRGDLCKLPFRDASFSFMFSRSVFEHLAKPRDVLNEFHRILKPGGRCAVLTPNFYDYSSIAAWLIPHAYHKKFVHGVYGPNIYDPFPVLYRANTPGYFRKLAATGGHWKVIRISGLRHYPAHLPFSRSLFRFGILYDK